MKEFQRCNAVAESKASTAPLLPTDFTSLTRAPVSEQRLQLYGRPRWRSSSKNNTLGSTLKLELSKPSLKLFHIAWSWKSSWGAVPASSNCSSIQR